MAQPFDVFNEATDGAGFRFAVAVQKDEHVTLRLPSSEVFGRRCAEAFLMMHDANARKAARQFVD